MQGVNRGTHAKNAKAHPERRVQKNSAERGEARQKKAKR